MTLTVAIGDIHGCYDQLLLLMSHIQKQTEGHEIKFVFLGDYIDRGPKSKEVLDYLIDIDNGNHVFLRGNHDIFAIDSNQFSIWMGNGGRATMASFYNDSWKYTLPSKYTKWIQERTKVWHSDDLRYYVHAGIYRNQPIVNQSVNVLTWIRNEFLLDESMEGGYIVHGHTPVGRVELKNNRCNLDTGCVFNGYLTAAVFDKNKAAPITLINHYGVVQDV